MNLSLVRFVLFDLGGVLVEFRGVEVMHDLLLRSGQASEDPASLEALWDRWIESPSVRRFERGLSEPEEFAAGVVAEFELPMSSAEFEAMFRGWITQLLPGALELLDDLPEAIGRGCLSNTNALHWPTMEGLGLGSRLQEKFLSYELGMVKPDAEIFEHCARHLGFEPHQVLFLDDNRLNVEGARRVGLEAARTKGPGDCRKLLEPLLTKV